MKFQFEGWRAVALTAFLALCVLNAVVDAANVLVSWVGGR